jgi:hypothetical protein
MRKLMLLSIVIMLILPLSSFRSLTDGSSSKSNIKRTTYLVGYFVKNSQEYEVWGLMEERQAVM